jgi:hypothetical protein
VSETETGFRRQVGPRFAFNKGIKLDEDENNTPTVEAPAETTPVSEPVVDENAAALSAAMAKIASITIELEAVKAELISTKAANWDLSLAANPNIGANAAESDPNNAVENDDVDDDIDEDDDDNPVNDFFGDKED